MLSLFSLTSVGGGRKKSQIRLVVNGKASSNFKGRSKFDVIYLCNYNIPIAKVDNYRVLDIVRLPIFFSDALHFVFV